ncbi:M20/M25/M40 family metallo-hydrolase [Thermophilibacter sp.]
MATLLERDPCAHFAAQDAYPDLDYEGAVRRLAAALRCRTVYRTPETTDFSAFDELQDLIRRSYPTIAALGTFELVGHSVLICVGGTDPALGAALLLAHQDVVPADDAGSWTHDPFGGHVDDEWVWGRGALDIKGMLMGELEAVEYLLARHGRPRRTVWLAFGEDEEVESRGATALAAELARRGVRAAFSLDEGVSTFADAAAYGAPGTAVADVCLSQKGYLDLRLSCPGRGGHSSNPFGGTSLERVCRAVARLAERPLPPRLTRPVADAFRALAPRVTEPPFAELVGDVDAHADRIAAAAARVRELYPLVCTTMSVAQVMGSASAPNVMPGDATATLNFRLLPGTGADDVVAWARRTVGEGVGVEALHKTPAGRLDEAAGAGYEALAAAIGRFHPDVTVVPSVMRAGADSIRYEGVCDCLLRFTPLRPDPAELARGVHGPDERVSRRVYAQAIRLMVDLLERSVL